jgi:hypothetical protein
MSNNAAADAIMAFFKMVGGVILIGVFILGLAIGGCVIDAFGKEPITLGYIPEPDTKVSEIFIYQFDDGVLLRKDRISKESYDMWKRGEHDFYISDNASDIYLMKDYQGKWLKGGVGQEPPAQAVLDVLNRKESDYIHKGLEKTFHYVIKGTSAIEDTSKYPPLQPERKYVQPLPEPETLHEEHEREIRTLLNALLKRVEKLERINGVRQDLPRRKPSAIIRNRQ